MNWGIVMSKETAFRNAPNEYAATLTTLHEGIKVEIMDKKRELAPVAEEMFSKANVRGTNGTVGELTNDFITRAQAFENGILMAMAKFYNKHLY